MIHFEIMREWRNWQTHHLEGVAPRWRVGSSPTSRTTNTFYNPNNIIEMLLQIFGFCTTTYISPLLHFSQMNYSFRTFLENQDWINIEN